MGSEPARPHRGAAPAKLVAAAGGRAGIRFLELFAANIRNGIGGCGLECGDHWGGDDVFLDASDRFRRDPQRLPFSLGSSSEIQK